VTRPTTRSIRIRAAELIEQDGHSKGHTLDESGQRCIEQALAEAAHESGDFRLYSTVRHELERELGLAQGATELIRWNDAPERTPAQVLAALRGEAVQETRA